MHLMSMLSGMLLDELEVDDTVGAAALAGVLVTAAGLATGALITGAECTGTPCELDGAETITPGG